MDKKRKFLYTGLRVSKTKIINTTAGDKSTNPHLLGFAHSIHVRAVGGIASLLVNLAIAANRLVNVGSGRAFVVDGHIVAGSGLNR